jgi:glycerol-1-phosphate dehydrogenase [NAD(P)+]
VAAVSIEEALKRAPDTRLFDAGAGVLDAVADVYLDCFGEGEAVVVADETTFDVARGAVEHRMRAAGVSLGAPIVFPSRSTLRPDDRSLAALEAALEKHAAIPVAVGSGTINDLTKLASQRTGRRHMVVATAASMDGYASFGAPITRDGFKQTFPCRAPLAILAAPVARQKRRCRPLSKHWRRILR